MKKGILLLLLTFSFNLVFAQSFEKVEVTGDELQFISHNHDDYYGVSKEDLDKIINLNKTIYFIEISYKEHLLYRASFRRYIPIGSSYEELNKGTFKIVINYKSLAFNPNLVLDMVSKYNWELKEFKGDKYLYKGSYQLFTNESVYDEKTKQMKNVYKINKLEPFDVKLYKMVEK